MKKNILAICAVLAGGLVFAQNSSLLEPTPETIGADSAAMALREINVDKFEREGRYDFFGLRFYHIASFRRKSRDERYARRR